MAFASFLGRVLFASVFILSAWQEFNEFGVDGGPAAKVLKPKFNVFTNHVTSNLGVQVPEIEIKHLVAVAAALKGIGSILFIFGSSLGANLLLLYQMIATPILYDFYNYDIEEKEFTQLFIKFTQSMALFGALLFFIEFLNCQVKEKECLLDSHLEELSAGCELDSDRAKEVKAFDDLKAGVEELIDAGVVNTPQFYIVPLSDKDFADKLNSCLTHLPIPVTYLKSVDKNDS
ncbi:hypothetical protein HHK36_012806 [Tetracentron sinense]|uniref:HR-like lesion-inducer n=1 Tax=Tetracentron sinense TaxID=13715 RepID=A0A834Z5F8_TETSI|nr:hypothetical protein HHK36_012806 [Tetracentron sinense]